MGVQFIEPAELKEMLENARRIVILDVRDDDFSGGNLRGAVNLPSEGLTDAALDAFVREHCGLEGGGGGGEPSSPAVELVVVHCYLSQVRGPAAARRLAKLLEGRERPGVAVLAGGWQRFAGLFAYSHPQLVEAVR